MSQTGQLKPIGWKPALTVLSINLVRGGNQVALKFALTALAPFWTAFGRMSCGALSVGAWAAVRGISLTPQRREWPALLSLGVIFAVQIALMHHGADYTSPAYATVLMNTNLIFANLLAHNTPVCPSRRRLGTAPRGVPRGLGRWSVVLGGLDQVG